MEDWNESALFEHEERAVLRLAEAMTATQPDVSDELFAHLREFFSPAQLVELSAEIAFENFRARFNRVFEIEPHGFSVR